MKSVLLMVVVGLSLNLPAAAAPRSERLPKVAYSVRLELLAADGSGGEDENLVASGELTIPALDSKSPAGPVSGLSGDIRVSNTYYEDPHNLVGKCDFVMANPPFTGSIDNGATPYATLASRNDR